MFDTEACHDMFGYKVVDNSPQYCVVDLNGRHVTADSYGRISERDACYIDKNGHPHSASCLDIEEKCKLCELDNALMADETHEVRRIVQEWIANTFNPIKSYNTKHSTYSLKHMLEQKTGIYLTNNQMKDALLNMGYACQNEHKINWLVNVSEMGIKYAK